MDGLSDVEAQAPVYERHACLRHQRRHAYMLCIPRQSRIRQPSGWLAVPRSHRPYHADQGFQYYALLNNVVWVNMLNSSQKHWQEERKRAS